MSSSNENGVSEFVPITDDEGNVINDENVENQSDVDFITDFIGQVL